MRFFVAILLLGALGCDDDGPTPPDDAFRDFVAAARSGQNERAWKMLSAGTRHTANNLVDAARAGILAAGEKPPANGQEFIFGSGVEMIREIRQVEVIAIEGDTAHLKVTDTDGGSLAMEMHLEEGAWRLVLPL